MSDRFGYTAAGDAASMDEVRIILTQSFADQEGFWEKYRERVGDENFRVLRANGEMVAACAALPCGQWFGGRVVSMSGIAAVGVPPHRRGRRYAQRLMEEVIRELFQDGVPLSVLYPASLALYRSAGYEPAGSRAIHSIDLRSVSSWKSTIPFLPITGLPEEPVREVARLQARSSSGNLERDDRFWRMLTSARKGQVVFGYSLGSRTDPVGYLFFQQEHKDWGYDLAIRDMAAATPEARHALWSFLAGHRTQSRNATWPGPAVDPRLRPLQEPDHRILRNEFWMLRIVNLRDALEQRGYPESLEVELHLETTDDLLEANSGRFVLRVSGGRGKVDEGGRGDLKIGIREFAPLYTGFFPASEFADSKTPAKAIEAADRIFGGCAPWMADPF